MNDKKNNKVKLLGGLMTTAVVAVSIASLIGLAMPTHIAHAQSLQAWYISGYRTGYSWGYHDRYYSLLYGSHCCETLCRAPTPTCYYNAGFAAGYRAGYYGR